MFRRTIAAASLLLAGTAAGAVQPEAPVEVVVPPPVVPMPAPPPPMPPRLAVEEEKAGPTTFEGCDGYPAPSRRTDGMTASGGGFWGMITVDGERGHTRYRRSGIDICTQILADPRLQPAHTLRRASLLQARALHRIAAGEHQAAFADLDLSDQAIGDDPWGRRSIGVNSALIRAYAQLQAGDREAAAQSALSAMALRPYEPSFAMAAAQLHLAATDDWDAHEGNLRTIARINPGVIPVQMVLALTRGDMAAAAALYPHIVLTTPRGRGGFQVEGLLETRLDQMVDQAELQGAYAYALAATGQPERAREQLAAARARLAEQLDPPLPEPGRTRIARHVQQEHDAFVARGPRATQAIDRWEMMVGLRTGVAGGNVQPVVAELNEGKRLVPDGATLELLRAASAVTTASAEAREEMTRYVAPLEQMIAGVVDRLKRVELADLVRQLPEPEARERLPAFDGGSDSILSLDANGFRTHRSQIEGARTVRFASQRGSLATSNEMALLRAAQLARQSGKSGLIVLGRRGMLRTMTTTMYGRPINSASAGQETELDVIFVDPANLPEDYADAGWRVLDATTVWNALSPAYPPPQRARR